MRPAPAPPPHAHPPSANLNTSYFTDRQDRYVLFTENPALAGYAQAFLHTAARFSYRLLPRAAADYTLQWPLADPPHAIEPAAASLLQSFQSAARTASAFALRPRAHPYAPSRYYALPSAPEEGIVEDAEDAGDDVLVFPVLQAGQLGIREEERAVGALFGAGGLGGEGEMQLTSGYFALPARYQAALVGARVPVRVLCAAPEVSSAVCR